MTSDLNLGNRAHKDKNYAQALKHYRAVMARQPELARMIKANISLVEKKLASIGMSASEIEIGRKAVESIDIVVPVFNALDDVKLCLQSLARNTDGFRVRVLVVNDGSEEVTSQWLKDYCAGDKIYQLIEHEVNRGYTSAVNTGLRASTADYVITQNSDTIVPAGWLKGMVRCMKSDPKIGVVGPLSNAATWQNVPTLRDKSGSFAVNDLPKGHSVETMAQIVASVSNKHYPRTPFLNGFCFMIRRAVIDKVGFMDEENFPIGYGEENDYCIRTTDAGYDLAIADDVFIFHAKSKSFGHERRKLLSEEGTQSIKRKHTPAKYEARVALIKKTELLDLVRKRISVELARHQNSDRVDLMKMRVLFLLPVKGGGGGAHSVVQEVTEMNRLGLHARVGVKHEQLPGFIKQYADIKNADLLFVGFDDQSLLQVAEDYDIVVGTIFSSMKLVQRIVSANPHILPAYYVQDYEPMFFTEGTPEWQEAFDSFARVPGAFLFAKTNWIINEVKLKHGLTVKKVQPSIDHEVYKPVRRIANERLTISAMIRPQTPRRGAERTMRLLAQVHRALGERIEIILFGCDQEHPDFQKLERDFTFVMRGPLVRPQVAELLAQSDLFIDMSDYQAFGRTALEAMACGCTAVVPSAGGANEYAIHQDNSLVLDTMNEPECLTAIVDLLNNAESLQQMQRKGLMTAARYSVHAAAISESVELETALKSWRTSHPIVKKPILYLIPCLRSDGLPTDEGYVRVIFPYKSDTVLRQWRVQQTNALPEPGSGKLVLLQREAIGHSLESLQKWLPKWKSSGGKLLYEIDDDLLEAESLSTNHYQGDIEATVEKVSFLVKNSDIVHVSTAQLAERLRPYNRELKVIPTALDVDLWRLTKPRQHDKGPYRRTPNGPVRIGYIGNTIHDEGIDLVTEAMQCIEKKYGDAVEIEVIGSFQNRKPSFGKRVALPQKNDYPNFARWLQERVHWDIGIIPVLEKKPNHSNNILKFLEYAALEMAIIVSDDISLMNITGNHESTTVIPTSNEKWIEAISDLIDNPNIRVKYSNYANKEIRQINTLNNNINNILKSISIFL